jgi:hypothetical protein
MFSEPEEMNSVGSPEVEPSRRAITGGGREEKSAPDSEVIVVLKASRSDI